MSSRAPLALALPLVFAAACGPKPVTPVTGPRTTEELQAEWEQVLRCPNVRACLDAIEKPRYVLDEDAERMAKRLTSFGNAAIPHLAKAAEDWKSPRRRDIAEAALLRMKDATLAYVKNTDTPQTFELLVRLALDTSLLPDAFPVLLERLPRYRGWLHGHLRSGPREASRNPGLAVMRLMGERAPSEMEPLCKLLDAQGHREWDLAVNVSRSLGFIGSKEATPCLVRALEIPSWRVTSAALEGLARIGRDAREAQRAVLGVATHHWSHRVRWRAVTTMRFLREGPPHDEYQAVVRALQSGHTYREYLDSADALVDPVSRAFATVPANDSTERENTPVCAWDRRAKEPILVEWKGRDVTLPPLDTRAAQERRSKYAGRIPNLTLEGLGIGLDVPLAESVRDVRPIGPHWLAASCAGEFGGGLLDITDPGNPRVLWRGCFVALRKAGKELWVFEGSQHLGDGYGRLWRVKPGKTPTLLPIADLPGNPLAGQVSQGQALIATNLGDVAVASDGSVTPMGCEPQ